MTRYYGGCSRCGGHEGNFESYLPNGCCVDGEFAGLYFCNACEEKLKDENEKREFSKKLTEERKKYENDENDEFLLLDGGPGYAASLFVRKDFVKIAMAERGSI